MYDGVKGKILQCNAGSAKLHEFAEYYLGARQAPGTGPATVYPRCTCQVCLTSKCFPAWSEARGLKSARLSRIGYCGAGAPALHYVQPLEKQEAGHYAIVPCIREEWTRARRQRSCPAVFRATSTGDKAADVPFKVQLTYMANRSLINWNLILYIKRVFTRGLIPEKKKNKKHANGGIFRYSWQ